MKKTNNNSSIFNYSDENSFREILKNDHQAFTPPQEAKTELFKALNIKDNCLSNGMTSFSFMSLKNIVKKYSLPFASSLLFVIGTLLVIYLNNDFSKIENKEDVIISEFNKNDNNAKVVKFNLLNSIININNETKGNNSKLIAKKIPITSSINIPSNKRLAYKNDDKSTENIKTNKVFANNYNIENNNLSENNFTIININNCKLINSTYLRDNIHNSQLYQQFAYIPNYNNSINKYSFQLLLKGVVGTTFNDQLNITNGNSNSFLAGIYTQMQSEDNFQMGIVFGKEAFEKKYFNKESRDIVEYTNNQNTFWLAIAGKFYTDNLKFSVINIRPFAELAIGAGEIGPMARVSAGIEQELIGGLSANISVDFSSMFYNNRYDWFVSKKLGISAGIIYNL